MITKWMCIFIYVVIIYGQLSNGMDIFISINKDYLPEHELLTVYNGSSSDIKCPFFSQINNSIVLKVTRNLISSHCNYTSNTRFILLIYSTKIRNSIITIKNEDQSMKKLENLKQPIFVLHVSEEYINFVLCSNSTIDCTLNNIEHGEFINENKLKIYSACKGTDGEKPCLTMKKFKNTITSNWKGIFGTEIIVSNSSVIRENFDCYHNGERNYNAETNKTSCSCPKLDAFVEHGPHCEALQKSLNQNTYLYVIPNSNILNIEFSLFSPGFTNAKSIFSISSNKIIFMNYNINETIHKLIVLGNIITLKYPMDTRSIWIDILISVSSKEIVMKINENKALMIGNFTNILMLDTLPLILSGEDNTGVNVCIRNIKINSKIVDLYTPWHSGCVGKRCYSCSDDQTCLYFPFKSTGNVKCICKSGVTNGTCTPNRNLTGNLKNNEILFKRKLDIDLNFIHFRFRTLSTNGTLMKLISNNPKDFTLLIKISSMFLSVEVKFNSLSFSIIMKENNVSDGEWHFVQIKITSHLLETKLDDYLPYNSNRTWIEGIPFKDTKIFINEIEFGPLFNKYPNEFNFTTCYDTITVIPKDFASFPISVIDLPDNITKGCYEDRNCTLNCSKRQKCNQRWQNKYCSCIDNFVEQNGSCVFIDCQTNPCLHGGQCEKSEQTKSFQCHCLPRFSGNICQNRYVTFYPLWIILLFLALLLDIIYLIIFIICFNKCKKSSEDKDVSFEINKIYENQQNCVNQAGESDYSGPPIKFDLIKRVLEAKETKSMDLLEKKEQLEMKNKDLNIDQPLQYEFEGLASDLVSVSSLGSGSTDNELNIEPLENTNSQFFRLRNIYK